MPRSTPEMASCTKEDEQLDIKFELCDSASNSALTASRAIGGLRGHVSKIMQQLASMLESRDFSRAKEIAKLKSQLVIAHDKFVATVKDFCCALASDSSRSKQYMKDVETRDKEVQELLLRVADFMLDGIETVSVTVSDGARSRHSKSKGSGRDLISSHSEATAMSSACKARMEAKLAEVRLEQVRRERALEERRAETRFESEQAILDAEVALVKARIRAESDQALSGPDGIESVLSPHDKVDGYLSSLNQFPAEVSSPAQNLLPVTTTGSLVDTNPVAVVCSVPVPVGASGTSAMPVSRVLDPEATPWLETATSAPRHDVSGAHGPAITEHGRSVHWPSVLAGGFKPPLTVLGSAHTQHSAIPGMVSSSAPGQLFPISGANVASTNSPRVPQVSQFHVHDLGAYQPTVVQGPAGNSRTLPDSSCSVNDVARMFARCQGTRTLTNEEKFDGNPLHYHLFMRQVQDRILNIYGNPDPGHALQLLLEATTGRARKLISNCVMLQPSEGLNSALQLLHKAFGSPDVAVKAHIQLVSDGPQIRTDERSLQDLYSDLVNCKMVVESAGALQLLNSASTIDGIFNRLPRQFQERFTELAFKKGYDMEIVPFDLFLEFIERSQRLASSRLGRLMAANKAKTLPNVGTHSKVKSARAHFAQIDSNVKPAFSPERIKSSETQRIKRCMACDSVSHVVWRCENFIKRSLSDRKALVRQKNLCFNCLGVGHIAKNCPSQRRCRTCSEAHHSLLHPPEEQGKATSVFKSTRASGGSSQSVPAGNVDCTRITETSNVNASCSTKSKKRLQVLPVRVTNEENGSSIDALALLDSGADTHLLSQRLYTQLGLNGNPIKSNLQLANGSVKMLDTFETKCLVRGVKESAHFTLEEVRIVDRLPDMCGSMPASNDLTDNEHLFNVDIPIIDADRIDLLIGMGSPELHIFSEVRQGSHSALWAGRTPLGWVLFGCEPQKGNTAGKALGTNHVNLILNQELDRNFNAVCPCQLDFVDLSRDDDVRLPSLDDEQATKSMESSCVWKDGHYRMRLPWKEGYPDLPNNYSVAQSRLKSIGRRLLREPETHAKYKGKIDEMIRLGHAFEVTDPHADKAAHSTWYIPHHCTGGKFRVVFDCAASFQGTSLNKQLLQGPDNTNSMIGVLFRFRPHSVAVVGDICNMFHQVRVDPIDQTALSFLWWTDGDPNMPVKVYQLTVHTFGLTSSPSIAGFALRRTAIENRTNASIEAQLAIQRHLYVDDLLISVEDSTQAVQLVDELSDLLASGGFQLAKYASSSREVLEAIPTEHDLATGSFHMAMRRFLAVRGHGTGIIYSDNGTNFTGASAELKRGLKRLDDHKITNELAPCGIERKHTPPLASHQGGIYEAIIRLVRKTMASMVADRHLRTLTDEGLLTLFKEIECILNNRPLTRVVTGLGDVEALTPSMLLTGSVCPGLPNDVFLTSDSMRSSWRACQFQADEFWRRWRAEYLPLLQRRQKWLAPQLNFKVGDLVLLVEESPHRNLWPKGVVEEVLPDRDDIVRRVKVRTADQKTFLRDIRKLCFLENDMSSAPMDC